MSAELQQVRREFADRIQREAGIRSSALVDGLSKIPREHFVGPGPWRLLRPSANKLEYDTTPDDDPRHLYDTVLVALDASRGLNNGEPSSLLRFLDMLDLVPGDRLLHIGCGVGYYTAIAAQAVLPGGKVVGVELDESLAESAKQNVLPYENVSVLLADGNQPLDGTFMAIFVNAGVTEIRSCWLDQLTDGGRLLLFLTVAFPNDGSAVLGHAGSGHTLLVTRRGHRYAARFLSPVAVFHCVGGRSSDPEESLEKAYERENQTDVRSLRRDRHDVEPDCWFHTPAFCVSLSSI